MSKTMEVAFQEWWPCGFGCVADLALPCWSPASDPSLLGLLWTVSSQMPGADSKFSAFGPPTKTLASSLRTTWEQFRIIKTVPLCLRLFLHGLISKYIIYHVRKCMDLSVFAPCASLNDQSLYQRIGLQGGRATQRAGLLSAAAPCGSLPSH